MNKVVLLVGWIILVLVVAATVLTLDLVGPDAATDAAGRPSAPAVREPPTRLEARARVVPLHHVSLSYPNRIVANGLRVAEVLVNEGETIEKGAPLVRVDTRPLELALGEAQHALVRAKSTYDQLRAEAEAARLRAEAEATGLQSEIETTTLRAEADAAKLRAEANVERTLGRTAAAATLEASAQSIIKAAETAASSLRANQETLAAARSAAEAATNAQLTAAQAQVQQVELDVQSRQLELEQGTIRAPMAGTIAEVNLKVGDAVVDTAPAVVLADLSAWQLETVNVTDRSVAAIQQGAPVTIRIDGVPDLQLQGTVRQVDTIGHFADDSDVATYVVSITPARQDSRLRWNMSASVVISPAH